MLRLYTTYIHTMIITEQIKTSLDEGLSALAELLWRALPVVETSPEEYVNMERELYHSSVETSLSLMQQRAGFILKELEKSYMPLATSKLSRGKYHEWVNTFRSAEHKLTPEICARSQQLLTTLGRMLNIGLTDEECIAKWEELKYRVSIAPQTSLIKRSALEDVFEAKYEEKPPTDSLTLARFILENPRTEIEAMAFFYNHPADDEPKMRKPRLTHRTFIYEKMRLAEGRTERLLNELDKQRWIWKEETPLGKFQQLFTGRTVEFYIVWHGTIQQLYYLFKRLTDDRKIKCPDGATRWEILESHFITPSGGWFQDLHRQKDPKNDLNTYQRMEDTL